MHWPPHVFWQSTLAEITAAVDGHIEAHCATRDEAMSRDELEDLKRQFPDE